jgi:hypothetical protein
MTETGIAEQFSAHWSIPLTPLLQYLLSSGITEYSLTGLLSSGLLLAIITTSHISILLSVKITEDTPSASLFPFCHHDPSSDLSGIMIPPSDLNILLLKS